jgi:hypothetical protein
MAVYFQYTGYVGFFRQEGRMGGYYPPICCFMGKYSIAEKILAFVGIK